MVTLPEQIESACPYPERLGIRTRKGTTSLQANSSIKRYSGDGPTFSWLAILVSGYPEACDFLSADSFYAAANADSTILGAGRPGKDDGE